LETVATDPAGAGLQLKQKHSALDCPKCPKWGRLRMLELKVEINKSGKLGSQESKNILQGICPK